MYDKAKINGLAEKYVETKDEEVFNELLKALSLMIDGELKKLYQEVEDFWDDLRQEVLIKLWENRGNYEASNAKVPEQYYYFRIRDWLHQTLNSLRRRYEAFDPTVAYSNDLVSKSEDEDWD